jgi:hypothetical protein
MTIPSSPALGGPVQGASLAYRASPSLHLMYPRCMSWTSHSPSSRLLEDIMICLPHRFPRTTSLNPVEGCLDRVTILLRHHAVLTRILHLRTFRNYSRHPRMTTRCERKLHDPSDNLNLPGLQEDVEPDYGSRDSGRTYRRRRGNDQPAPRPWRTAPTSPPGGVFRRQALSATLRVGEPVLAATGRSGRPN